MNWRGGNMLTKKSKHTKATFNPYEMNVDLSELEQLKLELYATKESLDAIYSILQNVTEPDLIDCAIYELKSVQMRYTFLHKKIVELSAS